MWARQIFAAVVAVGLLTQGAHADPDLTLVDDRALAQVSYVAPEWPVPDDPGQVFFIQRSMNSNTVVYVAQFDASGALDADQPLLAYWRRYNTDGAARTLSYVENRFAYGVRTRDTGDGGFRVTMRAIPDFELRLEPRSDGAALILPRAEGDLELKYGYLVLDEGGLLPSVTQLVLVGRDIAQSSYRRLTYTVAGAEIEDIE